MERAAGVETATFSLRKDRASGMTRRRRDRGVMRDHQAVIVEESPFKKCHPFGFMTFTLLQ
jgi:hypothetical protein